MDNALLHENNLKKEVLNLTDEAVSTCGIHFNHSKMQILLFYPNLDMIPMDFLKVSYGRNLVDEEAVASLRLQNPFTLENAQGEGEVKGEVTLETLNQRVSLRRRCL